MANLRGKDASEMLPYMVTLPETEGGPIEDGDANPVISALIKGIAMRESNGRVIPAAEYGSNENGHWTKFYMTKNTGLMVCWTISGSVSFSGQNGSGIWTFPQPFSETPYVAPPALPTSTAWDSLSDRSNVSFSGNNPDITSPTEMGVRVWLLSDAVGSYVNDLTLLAVGRFED